MADRTRIDVVRAAFAAYLRGDEPAMLGLMDPAGEHVVVSVHQRGRGKGSGVQMEGPAYFVCTVRGGTIVRWRMFSSEDEAMAALD